MMNELSQALQGVNPADAMVSGGAIGAILGGTLTLMVIFRFAWYFISALGYYKMFQKAGISGWKAFVPFYNDFLRFKMSWNTKFYWLYLLVSVLIYAIPTEQEILSLVVFACTIVLVVLAVKLALNMANSFGKSTGWGVLLFFFTFIVSLILGFGSAKYVGNTTVKTEETSAE